MKTAMRQVAILEADDCYEWQPQLRGLAEFHVKLDAAGLRYLSSRDKLSALAEHFKELPAAIFFLGGGDFHHLALPLIARYAGKSPFCVLVLDGHTDAFQAPDGFVSCGSWLKEVVKLPAVTQVLVLGSSLILDSLPTKVTSLTTKEWQHLFCLTPESFETLLPRDKLYVSIDKDVFLAPTTSCPITSWGTGQAPAQLVFAFLRWVLRRRQLVGADVCGEIRPRGPWPTLEELRAIRTSERLNIALCQLFLRHLAQCSIPDFKRSNTKAS